jgi:diacylglycerol O-acyltransferase
MRFTVPVATLDPVERMAEIHDRCATARAERSLPWTNAIAGALNLLPRRVIGGMLKHVDFLASNVPGITQPLYLAGERVRAFYAFGPTIGAALNVTLLSYCDTCYVGVNVDTGAVDDGELLTRCLRDGFAEILALAGDSIAKGA